MSRSNNYTTFTQWNTTQQKGRRSFYPSQQHGWNWMLSAVSQAVKPMAVLYRFVLLNLLFSPPILPCPLPSANLQATNFFSLAFKCLSLSLTFDLDLYTPPGLNPAWLHSLWPWAIHLNFWDSVSSCVKWNYNVLITGFLLDFLLIPTPLPDLQDSRVPPGCIPGSPFTLQIIIPICLVYETISLSVSYTHLTLPTRGSKCRSRWSPYH